MILRVGLTGGIASGKSTIARHFSELGCFTIDADQLVTELYRPGAAGHRALADAYGRSILDADGEVDRRQLADIAFASPAAARRLNELIHPLVIAEADRKVRDEAARRKDDWIAVVEATLLFESGNASRYDRMVVVDVSVETQVQRGIARGLTEEEVRRRIANQMPREERLRRADYVIDNSGSAGEALESTRKVVDALREDLTRKTMASYTD